MSRVSPEGLASFLANFVDNDIEVDDPTTGERVDAYVESVVRDGPALTVALMPFDYRIAGYPAIVHHPVERFRLTVERLDDEASG